MNTAHNQKAQAKERLTRSQSERKIFGVCGGLAEYFGIDPVLIRTAFAVLALTFGSGVILYLALAVIMPRGEEGTSATADVRSTGKLAKSRAERMIFGVGGGIAEYFDIDPVFVRIAFVALMFGGGAGILLYLILAVVMPQPSILATAPVHAGVGTTATDTTTPKSSAGSGEPGSVERPDRRTEALAFLLIIGGTLWLLSNTGVFGWDGWKIAWPILLVGLGSYLVLMRGRKKR